MSNEIVQNSAELAQFKASQVFLETAKSLLEKAKNKDNVAVYDSVNAATYWDYKSEGKNAQIVGVFATMRLEKFNNTFNDAAAIDGETKEVYCCYWRGLDKSGSDALFSCAAAHFVEVMKTVVRIAVEKSKKEGWNFFDPNQYAENPLVFRATYIGDARTKAGKMFPRFNIEILDVKG